MRDFVFARPGASFATPANQQAAATLQSWAQKGYFTPDFNGTDYDPAWQQFAKGRGRFLIAGTWVVADLAKAMGDRVGFMLMPPSRAGDPPVALGGATLPWAITAKSRHADVAAAYIDFLTDAQAAKVLVQTNNLPAMKTAVQPTGSLDRQVFAAWRRLSDDDGLVPYLDYATPTFYDDITAALQRLLGGTRAAGAVHRARPGRLREVRAEAALSAAVAQRPPGEPRRIAYLYLLPGARRLLRCSCSRRSSTRRGCRCSTGTASRRASGRARQLPRRCCRTPACARPFLHSLVLLVFYAVLPVLHRARARGGDVARARARRRRSSAPCCSCRRCRARRGGDDVADDLRARRGPLNRVLGAVGLGAPQGLARRLRPRAAGVGLVGTWVMYGLAMVLFMAGVQKIPQSLYDAARVDGAGPLREFFGVTLPGLRGEIAVALTLTTIAALRNFDLIYMTTRAGRATRPRCPR